jgi:DNA-binding NarL/FixJ family response regulator
MKISIGLADDHQLFLSSLSLLVDSLPEFQIVLQALNGKECLQKIKALPTPPDILILDVKMPVMDGLQTAKTISREYPGIKMVALSMKSDDYSIIHMLKAGCCAYLLKDIHPNELEQALIQINQHGYYNADAANINYRRLIRHQEEEAKLTLSEREHQFLQLACSDLTYKQIAAKMFVAERTIDGYRDKLFLKMNVQSRVGLAMEAIRRSLVQL